MKILALTAILLLALTACQRPQPVPVVQEVIVTATPDPTYPTVAAHTPDLPATIQALVNRPTVTPIPTATPALILPSVSTATPQPTATPQVFPTPLPTATPQAYPAFPTPQPTATPQVFPTALPTTTPLPFNSAKFCITGEGISPYCDRKARPGKAPVWIPRSITGCPLTIT